MSGLKGIYHLSHLMYYGGIVSNALFNRDLLFYKKKLLDGDAGNLCIYNTLMSGEACAISRFGGTEANTIADVLYTKSGGKIGGLSDDTINRISNLSGFFPKNKDLLYDFTDLYLDCAKDIDILGVWNVMMQKYLADTVAKDAAITKLKALEPYYYDHPWSAALEGRKVVIVHPFAELVNQQYSVRNLLFDNKSVLPEFDIRTVKAVQTLAGEVDKRFETWFDALDYLFDEVTKKDFDIALIGCGAYGLPLAVMIKRFGKQAVHIGGALQILFGIKGKRWDDNIYVNKFYNDAWVRPGDSYSIKNSSIVENSCYW